MNLSAHYPELIAEMSLKCVNDLFSHTGDDLIRSHGTIEPGLCELNGLEFISFQCQILQVVAPIQLQMPKISAFDKHVAEGPTVDHSQVPERIDFNHWILQHFAVVQRELMKADSVCGFSLLLWLLMRVILAVEDQNLTVRIVLLLMMLMLMLTVIAP